MAADRHVNYDTSSYDAVDWATVQITTPYGWVKFAALPDGSGWYCKGNRPLANSK